MSARKADAAADTDASISVSVSNITPVRERNWSQPALLLGAAAYLWVNLFRIFRTPFLLGGDQVFFWMYAQRMLNGERIYRDFFQFTPAGTDLIYFAGFRLFGPYVWVTNAVVFALGLALCWTCFSVASEVMDCSSALLAAALYLVVIYGKPLSGTHHFFSVLAIMWALKVMMRESTAARSLGAGALLGLASYFTQTHGAIALLAVVAFLIWEAMAEKAASRLRNPALVVAGYFAALLLLSAPMIATEGWRQLWYYQVTYVREHMSRGFEGSFLGLPPLSGRHPLFKLSEYVAVYLLIAIVYPLTLWHCWREREDPLFPLRSLVLLCVVGSALVLGMATNLNWLRVYAVSMPAVILLLWFVNRDRVRRRPVTAILWVAVVCVAVTQNVIRYRVQNTVVRLPGGIVAVDPVAGQKLEWIRQHSTPGDYFFQAAWPGVYLPLGLRNPVYVDYIQPADKTLPSDVASTLRSLEEKRVMYILWSKRLDSHGQVANGSPDNLEPLRIYVHSRYSVVKVFADGDSVLRRKQ